MSRYGTQFMESEAILAAGADDWTEVDKVLSRMTEKELLQLENACLDLARRALEWVSSGGAEL